MGSTPRSPVPYLSFEVAHEFLDKTYKCIKYLQRLGYMKFNYISEANPNFENPNWISADDLMIQLRRKDAMHWGDIHIKVQKSDILSSQRPKFIPDSTSKRLT